MFFKKKPSAKKINETSAKIMAYAYELKGIISSNCKEHGIKINMEELEYSTFLYDLFFYNQVMHAKYSNFDIGVTINTILDSFEANLNKSGNNIPKGYFQKIYKNLSKSLFDIYKYSKNHGMDEIYSVATYYCGDELQLTEEQFDEDEVLIELITEHFYKIMNLLDVEI